MHLSREYNKSRPIQNKPHRNNLPIKDYQDEQELYQLRNGDNFELKQIKSKMKVLVGKLAVSKKEKDVLCKENQLLQQQVMTLQNSLRHMVAGFSNSTSAFPMTNELTAKISEFYKYDCLDKFFDLLGPEELTIKGIIYFYLQSFNFAITLVDEYLEPALQSVKNVGCLDTLQGPVMNVLRKAFQTRHHNMIPLIARQDKLGLKAQEIIDSLGLGCTQKEEAQQQIINFLQKLIEIILECRISDPPLLVEVSNIGKRIQYNGLIHDPFDGFIKAKQECFVILPEVRKYDSNDVLTKSLVLHKNYDLSN